ncbi:MAG: Hsp20/alpha crystallin family protein [Halobacteriaceae archaeon]
MSRRNPFDELERMFDRMSRQFESEFGDFGELPQFDRGRPAVDVEDADSEYVVTVDLPGYDRDDIAVELREGTLHVSAERAENRETEETRDEGRYIRRERSRESVSRAVALPEAVDEAGTSATYNHGVLTVTLPKATGGGGRTIDVE